MPTFLDLKENKTVYRYKEAVQGKELERIFREEGVIDEEEEKEVILEPKIDDLLEPPVANSTEQDSGTDSRFRQHKFHLITNQNCMYCREF